MLNKLTDRYKKIVSRSVNNDNPMDKDIQAIKIWGIRPTRREHEPDLMHTLRLIGYLTITVALCAAGWVLGIELLSVETIQKPRAYHEKTI